jgi:ABC-type multidrug transport system ATPase subunit
MLEIKNYNSSILHEISFSLKENENLIILGENGAGKSTLAKVLSNLISNNKVELLGENISKSNITINTPTATHIVPGRTNCLIPSIY